MAKFAIREFKDFSGSLKSGGIIRGVDALGHGIGRSK